MSSTTTPAHKNQIANSWDFLTRPHPLITSLEIQQKSRVLAGVIIAFLLTSCMGLILLFTANETNVIGLTIPMLLFVGGLYVTNRRGLYRISATLLVMLLFVMMHLGFVATGTITWLFFGPMILLLSALFLSLRVTWLLYFTSLIIQLGLGIVDSNEYTLSITGPFIVFLVTIPMIIVFIKHLNELEVIRKRELQDANRQLQQHGTELEQHVEERTEELVLAKQELEVALRNALAADELKSQFLASMSHELRTPLNSILSFSDLMAMGVLGDVTEEQVEYLNKIVFSGRHLLALINDVLDISKMESGMMKLFVEEGFNVSDEVEVARSTVEKMVGEKDVQLVVNVDNDFPPLTVDKRRVRQVMLNLLSNAVKFTETGTITFSAKKKADEVLFSVSDTGPGIPEDQFTTIFEPFVQTSTGIKHTGGTGLGLPISKRLVEAHGGRLWVESTVGEGSAFFFTIPLRTVANVGEITMQVGV